MSMAEEETGQEPGEAPRYWWVVILAFFALLIFSTIISQYYKIGEEPMQPVVREPRIITEEEPVKEEEPPKEEKIVERELSGKSLLIPLEGLTCAEIYLKPDRKEFIRNGCEALCRNNNGKYSKDYICTGDRQLYCKCLLYE